MSCGRVYFLSCSLSKAHLEAIIVKFARELVVVLRDGLTCGSSTLAEHRRQVSSLRVNLLLAPCLAHVAFEGVWVNYGLDFGSPLVDHVVGRGEVALLERFLGGAVSREQVVLHSALAINHRLVVVSVLGLCKDHFTSFRDILVDSRGSGQVELGSLLRNAYLALFLTDKQESQR